MSIPEIFGWARSLLDSYGLTNIIIALAIIRVAISAVRYFTDK